MVEEGCTVCCATLVFLNMWCNGNAKDWIRGCPQVSDGWWAAYLTQMAVLFPSFHWTTAQGQECTIGQLEPLVIFCQADRLFSLHAVSLTTAISSSHPLDTVPNPSRTFCWFVEKGSEQWECRHSETVPYRHTQLHAKPLLFHTLQW